MLTRFSRIILPHLLKGFEVLFPHFLGESKDGEPSGHEFVLRFAA